MLKKVSGLVAQFRGRYLDTRFIFCLDLCLSVLASFAIVASTGLTANHPEKYIGQYTAIWMLASLVGTMAGMYVFKTYRIIIRHTTFKDVFNFGAACLVKSALMSVAILIWDSFVPTIWFMMILDMLLTLALMLGTRLAMIGIYDAYKSSVREVQKCERIMVYGSSNKSKAAVVRLNNSKHYEVIGVIVPETEKLQSQTLNDKQVFTFSSAEDVAELAEKNYLSAILFARDEDIRTERSRLVDYCISCNVKVYNVPSIEVVSEKQYSSVHLQEVKIEDLLGRDEIKISMDEIRRNFTDKVVMVTGGAGSIGSELCRQLAAIGVKKLVLFDNAETPTHNIRLELEEKFPDIEFAPVIGDVRQVKRLDFAFRKFRPQIVFHAAAYKHVPLMEENPCEAVLVNVAGSRNVADKCIEFGVEKMVMVSTDKAVNPTNIMGCTKRLAEIYVQSLGLAVETGSVKGGTKFVTTRFGNVLGSNGSVIPRFREQILKGGPVTVTHPDITRFFMTIPEACRLVMEAATMPTENRICVFDMGDPVKIDTLARRMISLSGLVPDKDIEIKYTGLRPGEKLYEEVLSSVENTEPTTHDRIRIAHVREYKYEDAAAYADRLEELSREVNIPEMVMLMKEIVPEYKSNNSEFSKYDK